MLEMTFQIVDEQSDDPMLWGQPATIVEDALQKALRRLHAAIEKKTPSQCAADAIQKYLRPMSTHEAAKPFYSDADVQFNARDVGDEDMALWEKSAGIAIQHMVPGGMNWPMIVRSLIAEVKKLRKSMDAAVRGEKER